MTSNPSPALPYWRLSSYYFFHFAILGVVIPYWSLVLKDRGLDAQSIGELVAILLVAKTIAPYLWGWLCDHLGHRMTVIRIGTLLAVITFSGLFWANSFWTLALWMMLYSFFWNANLPQFEAITFNYLREQVSRYTQIRIWGSIGFMLAVAILGWLVDWYSSDIVLPVTLTLFICLWLRTLWVAEPPSIPHPPNQVSLWHILRRPVVIAFFASVFLMQTSHGPYYTFYTLYLDDFGYAKSLIGQLWALCIAAEIGFFMVAHRCLNRWPVHTLLITSFLAAMLRWVMIALLPESLIGLICAQLLHALTFGLFHATAIHWVHHYFRGRLQGRGQALYSSFCFGAGGAVGSLASGYMWEDLGPQTTYLFAVTLPAISVILIGSCIRSKALVVTPDA